MNDEPRWADRIQELRAERREKVLELRGEGMTQAQIADALGVAVGTVNRDLTGEDAAAAPAPMPESRPAAATAGRTAVPVAQLRSGSLPESTVPEDDSPASVAEAIMRRQSSWRN